MNLCYSTYLGKNPPDHLREALWNEPNNGDYYRLPDFVLGPRGEVIPQHNPHNPCFLFSHKKEGILPKLLKDLLAERKRVRKEMATMTDPIAKEAANALQLSVKVCANSSKFYILYKSIYQSKNITNI